MISSSDFTGAELKTAEPVVIQFRDGMTFTGRTEDRCVPRQGERVAGSRRG